MSPIINKFNSRIDSEKELYVLVNRAYQANKNFFNGEISEISVNFLYSRKEMNISLGRETPDWVVGHAPNTSIFVFSPTVFDKVSSHPATNFFPVLIHEMTHIFIKELFGQCNNKYPWWFNEGIAGYVSKQYKKYSYQKIKPVTFDEISFYKDWLNKSNYPQSFLFTQFLFEKYPKNTILKLLMLATKQTDMSQFSQSFFKATGEEFIKVTRGWFKIIKVKQNKHQK